MRLFSVVTLPTQAILFEMLESFSTKGFHCDLLSQTIWDLGLLDRRLRLLAMHCYSYAQ